MANNTLEEYWKLIQVVRGYAEYERRYAGDSVYIAEMQERLDFFSQAWQQQLVRSVIVQPPIHISEPPWLHQEKRTYLEESAAQKPANMPRSPFPNPLGGIVQEQPQAFQNAEPPFVPDLSKYPNLSLEERKTERERVRQMALKCRSCALCQSRTQVVFGCGPVDAKLVIVGEAPGFYEDKAGLPFVGDSGDLLTKMLLGIGIKREEVYICNVVQCRPPANRTPEPEELTACQGWLQAQLHLLRPTVLFALGVSASRALTGVHQSMWQYRNIIYAYEGIPLICSYHPAYLLRNPDDKKKAWQDLLSVKSYLERKTSEEMGMKK